MRRMTWQMTWRVGWGKKNAAPASIERAAKHSIAWRQAANILIPHYRLRWRHTHDDNQTGITDVRARISFNAPSRADAEPGIPRRADLRPCAADPALLQRAHTPARPGRSA